MIVVAVLKQFNYLAKPWPSTISHSKHTKDQAVFGNRSADWGFSFADMSQARIATDKGKVGFNNSHTVKVGIILWDRSCRNRVATIKVPTKPCLFYQMPYFQILLKVRSHFQNKQRSCQCCKQVCVKSLSNPS